MVRRWWLVLSGRRRAQRMAWAVWQLEKAKRLAELRAQQERDEVAF